MIGRSIKWETFVCPLFFLSVLVYASSSQACTIAVVSGKATEDGRPLLWKNRDTSHRRNLVRAFSDGKYRLVAVVDAGNPNSIWMGMNEKGLCVINSVSRDLPGGSRKGRGNGRLMKLALQTCANAAEFEKLLVETNESGRRTRANFGVIDASGAALLFETGHRSFVKFDANDSATHPGGFIIRSNFAMSETGRKFQDDPEGLVEVYSGERYLRAKGRIENHVKERGRLNYRFILQHLCRDLSESVDGPICSPGVQQADGIAGESLVFPGPQIDTRSTINRKTTVSTAVFHGVKAGNAPKWTTMWTLLGAPVFSVAVPCWMTPGRLPAVLHGPERSPLCAAARQLRDMNYDTPDLLSTRRLKRISAETLAVENRIIRETRARLQSWRSPQQSPGADEIVRFQTGLAESALHTLQKLNAQIRNEPALAQKPDSQPDREQLVTAENSAPETAGD